MASTSSSIDQWKEFVETVKSKTDIVEVIGEDVEWRSQGSAYKACSPFREDNSPSFCVWPDSQKWKDYSGGGDDSGDVIAYVEKKHGISFREAVLHLAQRIGLEPPEGDKEAQAQIERIVERRKVERLLTLAADFYHHALPTKIRHKYYRDHYGLTDATVDDLMLGWSNGNLAQYFRDIGIPDDEALATGLFVKTYNGHKDFFENRLIFPYWRGGNVVYMIGRRTELTENSEWEEAKYKKLIRHSDKHDYVSKTVSNEWFYNEDSALNENEYLLITEGVTDCISAKQAGIPVISPVTTRFRHQDHEKLIRMTSRAKKVVICNDVEDNHSGEKGALKTAEALTKGGRDVYIATLPTPEGGGKIDVNEFVKANGGEPFRKVIESSVRYHEYLVERIPADTDPSKLDKELAEVAKAVSSLGGIERDAFIDRIAKRFSIKRKLVDDIFKHGKKAAEGEKKKNQPAAKKNEIGGFGNYSPDGGGGSSDDWDFVPDGVKAQHDLSGLTVVGQIYEADSFYYRLKNNGDPESISSFRLDPTKRVQLEDGSEYLVANVRTQHGSYYRDVMFPRQSFYAKKDFLKSMPGLEAHWTGNDDNVQGLAAVIASKNVPVKRGVSNLGLVESDEGDRWVVPDGVFDAQGPDLDGKIMYVQGKGSLAKRLHFPIELDGKTRYVLENALPRLARVNDPKFIVPLLGWFFATPIKHRIMKLIRHFPIAFLDGTGGAGKTSTLQLLWRVVGVKEVEPYSVTEPEFAMTMLLSSTNSIPIFMDEYKPRDMGKQKVERLGRMLRRLYGGETEERGRPDLSVVSFKLLAPLVVGGESKPENDPALMERLISVSPSKTYLAQHPEARQIYKELWKLELERIALPFAQYALAQNTEKQLDEARGFVEALAAEIPNGGDIPIRAMDNFSVVALGLALYIQFASENGIEIEHEPFRDALKHCMAQTLDGEKGVKDIFDSFLEQLSVYAQLGHLVDGRHYAVENGKLYLHIPTCLEAYRIHRKQAGLEDETNGERSLRRIIREKFESGSYITSVDARVPGENGIVRRMVEIDTLKLAATSSLNVDQFPTNHGNGDWAGLRVVDDFGTYKPGATP